MNKKLDPDGKILQAVNMDDVREYFAKDQFATSIGIKLLEVRPGYAVSEMEITEQHLNALKIVQGGAVFTLADYTFAAASNAYGQWLWRSMAVLPIFRWLKGKS